ncbi:phosphatidylinositol-glycan biosynthesis class X protein isoform X2 [Coturnix japonica]|uniref:phosphatidylinositol-glycan biosynthesis class X protein isoform X2 n=1 Tax=Coturnix japonica TaxID=93934 RepID=UPI00077806C2|nr:phosphatidylinositol-glycan biosynthesis class X protein isoform X2 [Coturnix japonica]
MAAVRWRWALSALLCAFRVSIVPPWFALRELLVKAELGSTGQWTEGCTVAARTQLPAGVYVDPDELASLQQHNVTKAVLIPDVVDVEAPEYSAPALTVVLYLQPDPRCGRCFRAALPVHGRYHRPAGNSEDALVALKSPEILVCCCDEHLSPDCWQPADVEAPCPGNKDRLCQWYGATHQPESEELILRVPVGLTQHSVLVCVVTLLATVLCSSLILTAVCRYGDFSLVTCLE